MTKKLFFLAIVFIAVILCFYFYGQHQKSRFLKSPEAAAIQETADIKNRVGKLTELPAKEEPIVLKVEDEDELKEQEFYMLAQKGDIVLVYPKTGKEILYRPKTNKIIKVGIIESGQNKK